MIPHKIRIPNDKPTPSPTLAPVLNPDGGMLFDEAEGVADEVAVAELLLETVDELGVGGLSTISPVLSRNTPEPSSQHLGFASQQKLPF